jgi:hypothetical protein
MARSKRVQLDDDPAPEVTTRPSRNKRQKGTDVEILPRAAALFSSTTNSRVSTNSRVPEQPNMNQDQTNYDHTAHEALDDTWQKPGKVCLEIFYLLSHDRCVINSHKTTTCASGYQNEIVTLTTSSAGILFPPSLFALAARRAMLCGDVKVVVVTNSSAKVAAETGTQQTRTIG